MSVHTYSVAKLSKMLQDHTLSSLELTQIYLERIQEREGEIHAMLHVCGERAKKAAKEADERRVQGNQRSELDGIPFTLKDNIAVAGLPMTCGSKFLQDFVPPYSAAATIRLEKAGAVLLGKNNMDEFAIGSSTENSAFGPTINPLRKEMVAGGSSGGSAAAVAARETAFAIGTDTGGSVRQPAACCGIVGFKPSYGLVSRDGVAAVASSMDQVGVLAGTVKDTAIILNQLVAYDPQDSMSWPKGSRDYLEAYKQPLTGMKVGVLDLSEMEDLEPAVHQWLEAAKVRLVEAGVELTTVKVKHLELSLACYYVLMSGEFSANMGRYDGARFGRRAHGDDYFTMVQNSRSEGFGKEVKTRILFGTHVLSSAQYQRYYVQAMKIRRMITDSLNQAFSGLEAILLPVQNGTAFPLGERSAQSVKMAASDQFLIPANLAGLPAISVPIGQSQGLPGAVQVMGPQFSDGRILALARQIEGRGEYDDNL